MSTDPFASPSQAMPAPSGQPAPPPAGLTPSELATFAPPSGAPAAPPVGPTPAEVAAFPPPTGAPLAPPATGPGTPTTQAHAGPQSYPGYSSPAFPAFAPLAPPPTTIDAHATWAKVGAIAAAVAGLAWALYGFLIVQSLTPAGATAAMFLVAVGALGAIAGYLTLCMWMMRVKELVQPQGYPAPAGWQIWASWFIPFYGFYGPVKAMSDLGFKAGKDRMASFLAMWWGGFLLFTVCDRLSGIPTVGSDVMVVLAPVMALATLVSFAGLWILIVQISRVAAAPAPVAMPQPPAPPIATA